MPRAAGVVVNHGIRSEGRREIHACFGELESYDASGSLICSNLVFKNGLGLSWHEFRLCVRDRGGHNGKKLIVAVKTYMG